MLHTPQQSTMALVFYGNMLCRRFRAVPLLLFFIIWQIVFFRIKDPFVLQFGVCVCVHVAACSFSDSTSRVVIIVNRVGSKYSASGYLFLWLQAKVVVES